MKKLTVLLGMSIIILVSGCSNENKLTCTKKENSAGYDLEQNISFIVKKEKIKELDTGMKIDYGSMKDAEFKEAYEMMKSIYTNMESEGIKSTIEKENKVVMVNVNIDFDKADEKATEQFLTIEKTKDDKVSIDSIKKDFEKDGYTCK